MKKEQYSLLIMIWQVCLLHIQVIALLFLFIVLALISKNTMFRNVSARSLEFSYKEISPCNITCTFFIRLINC